MFPKNYFKTIKNVINKYERNFLLLNETCKE